MTLRSEYLQAEHTDYTRFDNLSYIIMHMSSQVVSESTQQQQDIMWKSETGDTQEGEEEKKSFPCTKGADKNHVLKRKQ